MRFLTPPPVLALVFSAAFVCPAAAECMLNAVATVPLTIDGPRLRIPVSMNETAGEFAVDTGAGETVLMGPYAARAHVGMDIHAGRKIFQGGGGRETLPVNSAHVRTIQVGELKFQDWEFAILPDDGSGLAKFAHDGILGMDFLHYFDMDVDLEAHKITLWRVTGCKEIHPEWQGPYETIPLTGNSNHGVNIPILVDGAILDVGFDTGAVRALLSREAAAKAGVTDAMLLSDHGSGAKGVGGKFPSVSHEFKMMMVGNSEFDHPTLTVETESHRTGYSNGLIEWRYLKPRRFWLSFTTQSLFVQHAAK
jgi:predicted aspartyl protease